VRPGLVDHLTLRIDYDAYKPVGRIVGSHYARQHDRFAPQRQDSPQRRRHARLKVLGIAGVCEACRNLS
jgi:hypothetical protein